MNSDSELRVSSERLICVIKIKTLLSELIPRPETLIKAPRNRIENLAL